MIGYQIGELRLRRNKLIQENHIFCTAASFIELGSSVASPVERSEPQDDNELGARTLDPNSMKEALRPKGMVLLDEFVAA